MLRSPWPRMFWRRARGSRMPLRSLAVRWASACLLVAGLWLSERTWHDTALPPAQAQWPEAAQGIDFSHLQRVDGGDIPMPANTPAAHASNLLVMPPDHAAALTAFWFAGERESAPDVQIAASQWDRATQRWSSARFVVNRHAMGAQLGFGLRRLGNPVAWLDGQGRMHLFVVATGWGGWAASRILHLRQSSAGQGLQDLALEPVGLLPLSWLWNTSLLVRNTPLPLQDGGMLLPVHFELGLKHAIALRFDSSGNMVAMERISPHHDRLQPALVAQSPSHWLAFMRVQRPDGKIAVAQQDPVVGHWHDLPDLTLENPDSALAALGLSPGHMVLAFNPSATGRSSLALAHSADGMQWNGLHTLAQGKPEDEFSYPSLAWADGALWVSYTVDRKRIVWQRFAPAPMEAKP